MNESIPYLITMENGCELELHTDVSRPYFEIDKNKGVVVYLDELLMQLAKFDETMKEYIMVHPEMRTDDDDVDVPNQGSRLVDPDDFSARVRVLFGRYLELGWNEIQSMQMALACMERVNLNYIE